MSIQKDSKLIMDCLGSSEACITARAPGRVNLIGEHTDYNGGYVLPFAIDRETVVTVRPRRDSKIRVYAAAFDETTEIVLPLIDPAPTGAWGDYLVGILLELQRQTDLKFGFDGVITGNVPLGAGLSSSASLEVALALSISHLYDITLEDLELIKLCQRVENDFVGTQSGIMDQYVSLLARDKSALLLDTRSLKHRYISLDLRDTTFLIVDSAVRRSLFSSGYNDRRRECQEALRLLQERMPEREIHLLSDLNSNALPQVKRALPRTLMMRVRHVVEENSRVLETVSALKREDLETVGKLLFASHASLRDLFQVSTEELDFLVNWAREHGALGARLVGGGFGGATLHLVQKDMLEEYTSGIKTAYHDAFGLDATTIEVRPSSGAKELERR